MLARVELCTPQNGLVEAARLLRAHFFTDQGEDEFYQKLSLLVSGSISSVSTDGAAVSRVFAAKDKEATIGSGEVRLYSARKLAEQLLIRYDDDFIWLSKMGWELSGLGSAGIAVELAYFAVEERYRGQGIGAAVFYKSLLSVLRGVDGVSCSLFTIAKGMYTRTGKGQAVRGYLLEVEREANRVEGDRILVKGVRVLLKEV